MLAAGALLGSSQSQASSIDKVVVLSRQATNFDMDAAPNGDLHVACRAGSGNPSNFKRITYFKYTKATDSWSNDVLVFQGSTFDVSPDIDTNQPSIAFDPVGPDPGGGLGPGSWITFSGNVRRDNDLPTYYVRNSDSAVAQGPSLQGNLGLIREVRAVDITVAPDGHVWGCFNFTSLGDPNQNGIFCNNNGGSVERATGKDAAGEGLSVSMGPNGQPHIMTTFGAQGGAGRNAAWSPRDGVSGGGAWSPGNLLFGGFPLSAGKVSCVDTTSNQSLDCAAITANPSSVQRIAFAYSMVRPGNNAAILKASGLANFGITVEVGDFNSENIKYARSPQGKEAIAFAMDSDTQGPLDLAIVVVKPEGVDWPQTTFTDANNDSINDELGGTGQSMRQYFTTGTPDIGHVFEGSQGRATIAFVTGENPAVGFAGEDLWVVYNEDDIAPGKTKAVKITVGQPVPEASVIGLLILLAGFSVLLLGRGSRREARGVLVS